MEVHLRMGVFSGTIATFNQPRLFVIGLECDAVWDRGYQYETSTL